jgi:hypothetical protein
MRKYTYIVAGVQRRYTIRVTLHVDATSMYGYTRPRVGRSALCLLSCAYDCKYCAYKQFWRTVRGGFTVVQLQTKKSH